MQHSAISIKIGSGPTGINFQPIAACEGSISVADTVSQHYQGSQTVGDRQKPSESIKSSQETRANTFLRYRAEDSRDENGVGKGP
jgi:hypothetical protein